MIIDADVHISPVKTGGNSLFIDEVLRRMDDAEVDKAVTWLQPPHHREIKESNAYVYKAFTEHPDRVLGFGWADPNMGLEHAKEMVKRSLWDYGFYGVKFNGAQNEYFIDDPKNFPLYEEVAKAGKILAFHIGGDAPEFTHPFRLAKIAKAFPDTKILMVHMGGAHFHDMGNAAIEFAEQHSNIYIVGSVIRAQPLLKAVKTLGANRVCFGSDTPFELMHVEVAKYGSLFKNEVTKLEYDMIMGQNISRLFGLETSLADIDQVGMHLNGE